MIQMIFKKSGRQTEWKFEEEGTERMKSVKENKWRGRDRK